MDYVKTGIGSIIEDDVTNRFVAEELKSWNLMTRTNGNEKFEFINWHLTFMWLTGGFFRYCILFPARLTILIIGVGIKMNIELLLKHVIISIHQKITC